MLAGWSESRLFPGWSAGSSSYVRRCGGGGGGANGGGVLGGAATLQALHIGTIYRSHSSHRRPTVSARRLARLKGEMLAGGPSAARLRCGNSTNIDAGRVLLRWECSRTWHRRGRSLLLTKQATRRATNRRPACRGTCGRGDARATSSAPRPAVVQFTRPHSWRLIERACTHLLEPGIQRHLARL